MPEPRTAGLERGRDAYERHAWEEALAHLSRADVEQELGPEDRARRLSLSPHTIHRHLSNIRRKTNQPSRSGAVAQAARTGLI